MLVFHLAYFQIKRSLRVTLHSDKKIKDDHMEVSSKKANPALKVTNLQVSRSPFPRKKKR